ncbi:MAG: ABC transporter ATP-binding protein [Thiomonas sp.]|uniref:Spermidine/putrescine import ATP-binding protein PotA n=1 Tax=Thiomonas arsenitoxydans (strain DSM 22701 / CIP 110005 / 3As) TaxID=426114 RepID=D6CQR6_THIA3|nr:ABC transporter ATP-binding protein [Thiomonas arsenitoxydans]MDE1977902.1 ABC transporter ATP-binding protein [Betaproteobacteria bacterium]MBN8776101.1 ABC transporter ATP-binding protein [Thiomonas arsenitoxydans]MDE2269852.1 ABC transporter ATP-binding protein [Betaproteobacteria bacterium]CAZ86957.1 Putrescine transport ATP-binding protein potG; polyamine ABC transporter [Thiomonas arsenitoxydans]CQR27862.1 putrescine transporter subunit: ATP-binding component of ABC superfamily [Thiom
MTPPSPSAKPFLRIDGITRRFDEVVAVNDIHLDIQQGEIFALLGSSGCGKSTLLRMLGGFETPTSGHIYLEGEDITDLPPYERPINMMFQSYALFPHLTVFDNIAFGLKRDGMPKADIATRVEQMLDLVQLKPYGKRKPHQLSGGQQQRVALARSLAKRPKLLLLDEPLAALDKKLRERTQLELVNILRKVGVTCVMVTHDQEEAMTMADRIAVMKDGEFLQLGTPIEIYEHPQTRFIADFIGNVNMFDGRLVTDEPDHCEVQTDDALFYIGHGISGTLNMELGIALRPEKMTLTEGHQSHPNNAFQGTVSGRSYMGSYTAYELLLPSKRRVRVTVSNADRHADPFDVGAAVTAHWADNAPVVIVD